LITVVIARIWLVDIVGAARSCGYSTKMAAFERAHRLSLALETRLAMHDSSS